MNSRLHQIKDWGGLAHAANYKARELAEKCSVSLRQLQRFILSMTGKPPQKWLNELRLKRACSLMESGQSVKEAANELKYKQRSHFSREYKRYYGVAPSSVRQLSSQIPF